MVRPSHNCLPKSLLNAAVYAIDCKVCHVCDKKGDEAKFLLCDCCDRGWHIDCLKPPHDLNEMPAEEAKWHCPVCPPYAPTEEEFAAEHVLSGESDSSTSDSSDESTSDGQDEADVSALFDTLVQTSQKRNRARPKPSANQKSSADKKLKNALRSGKRKRAKGKTSGITLRLLPPRRDEKGIFDDILSKTERDTAHTTIQPGDRTRFEKSRSAADVCYHNSNQIFYSHTVHRQS